MTSKYKQKCIREGLQFRKMADGAIHPLKKRLTLMDIPAGLRLHVFEIMIGNGWNPDQLNKVPTLKQQAILNTCPQIRNEALDAWRNVLKRRREKLLEGRGDARTLEELQSDKT